MKIMGFHYFKKLVDGGQANVDKGRALGIYVTLFKKGDANISSKVGRFNGSNTKIFEIKFLALSEIPV